LALNKDEDGDEAKDLKRLLVTSGAAHQRGHRTDKEVDRTPNNIVGSDRQSWRTLATSPHHGMTSWHHQSVNTASYKCVFRRPFSHCAIWLYIATKKKAGTKEPSMFSWIG
jgi:hypothetical protein